jgi:hypothetical protein
MAQITQIQVRRDVSTTWTSVNPTLASGEIGFETDTGKFKIGPGAWTSLTYATDGSKLTGTIAASTATTLATARNINGVSFNGSADITVPAAAGTLTGGTLASGVTGSSLTSVGTIGTGTWQGSIVQPTYGGTGNIYGASLVGRAVLSADKTKPLLTNAVEAFTYDNAGTPGVQYLNLDANTLYSFEGYAQMTKDSITTALPRAGVLYYSTGTTVLAPQAVSCQVLTQSNGGLYGLCDITTGTTNLVASSTGTGNTTSTYHFRIAGYIWTNASTAGRFSIGIGPSVTVSAAPVFKAGSYLAVYKHGTNNTTAPNFGNWTA